jgi:hypothetical protein
MSLIMTPAEQHENILILFRGERQILRVEILFGQYPTQQDHATPRST